MWRVFLFLIFPALELYLLVKAGAAIGPLKMVLWVFGSAFFGIWVARAHSQYSMLRVKADIEAGKTPQNTIVDGLLIFLAGVLLILPGLITDAVGLLLLLPPFRRIVTGSAGRYLEKNRAAGQPGGGTTIFFTRGFGSNGFGSPGTGDGFRPAAEDEGPRQATIIESTAIEITPEEGEAGEGGNARQKE